MTPGSGVLESGEHAEPDMSGATSGPVSRLVELHREGGLFNAIRGANDYVRDHTPIPVTLPLHRIVSTGTLSVGAVAVDIHITSDEDLWRAMGHGEDAVLDDFVGRVRPNDTVWDVGANIGSYSLLAAATGASVIAFEPGSSARQRLQRNAEGNGLSLSIRPVGLGLSDANGSAALSTEVRSGIRHISEAGEQVPVARGEDVDLPGADIIKIDVEGHERQVLDGLGDRLEACRCCYVEIHGGVSRDAVEKRLENAGLEVADEWGETRREAIVRADGGGA
ncbi:hypothetical protein DQW50_16305 [Halorubrum sp. 48-1-W]|uniref:FkbM family methyltransferase n=1 Tax=Halorubrum sp. 48-1-W TaxID=2249761 RepID=UPI000DCE4085|nr:FkbM family methyltransferase [Halorubrum sp. 48-1-W]RAW44084.1 hypothetical protein DQW50_16305 [Halorubrum sp. 48-1-W]